MSSCVYHLSGCDKYSYFLCVNFTFYRSLSVLCCLNELIEEAISYCARTKLEKKLSDKLLIQGILCWFIARIPVDIPPRSMQEDVIFKTSGGLGCCLKQSNSSA